MTQRPCRGCGMTIEIREGPNGKPIPLQRIRTVYYLDDQGVAHKVDFDAIGEGLPVPDHYVSHFETCPKAATFSRGGKK